MPECLNRYSAHNAAWKIESYLPARPTFSIQEIIQKFESAKSEIVQHLQRQIKDIENISFDQFIEEAKNQNFSIHREFLKLNLPLPTHTQNARSPIDHANGRPEH